MSGAKVSQDDESSKRNGLDPERVERARRRIALSGLNMSDWARRNGFSIKLVHEILAGKRPCVRGVSHRIAILLDLKDGKLPDIDERAGGLATEPRKS